MSSVPKVKMTITVTTTMTIMIMMISTTVLWEEKLHLLRLLHRRLLHHPHTCVLSSATKKLKHSEGDSSVDHEMKRKASISRDINLKEKKNRKNNN